MPQNCFAERRAAAKPLLCAAQVSLFFGEISEIDITDGKIALRLKGAVFRREGFADGKGAAVPVLRLVEPALCLCGFAKFVIAD